MLNARNNPNSGVETYRKLYEKVQENLDKQKVKLMLRQQAAITNQSQPGLNALVSDSLSDSQSQSSLQQKKKKMNINNSQMINENVDIEQNRSGIQANRMSGYSNNSRSTHSSYIRSAEPPLSSSSLNSVVPQNATPAAAAAAAAISAFAPTALTAVSQANSINESADSPFQRFFVINQDKVKGNRKFFEGIPSQSKVNNGKAVKSGENQSAFVSQFGGEEKEREIRLASLKRIVKQNPKSIALSAQSSTQNKHSASYISSSTNPGGSYIESQQFQSSKQSDSHLVNNNNNNNNNRKYYASIKHNGSFEEVQSYHLQVPNVDSIGGIGVYNAGEQILNLSRVKANNQMSSLASIPDLSARKAPAALQSSNSSMINLSKAAAAGGGGANESLLQVSAREDSKLKHAGSQSQLRVNFARPIRNQAKAHSVMIAASSQQSNANASNLGGIGASQKSMSALEDRTTFSELFKGVKVTQNDIDQLVANDPRLFRIPTHKEESIANFSQENVNSFFKDMFNLRYRAKQLKKNINLIPEKVMINLRSNNNSPRATAVAAAAVSKQKADFESI